MSVSAVAVVAQHFVTCARPPCRPHSLRSLFSQLCSASWPQAGSRLRRVPTRREPAIPLAAATSVHPVPHRLIRTSILLTLTCCYLMWMVTYLAQVHPLERKSRTSSQRRSGMTVLQVRGEVSLRNEQTRYPASRNLMLQYVDSSS